MFGKTKSNIPILRISGPLQSVMYWDGGKAYTLISWDEDEDTALGIAEKLKHSNYVKVVLNNQMYGVYIRKY